MARFLAPLAALLVLAGALAGCATPEATPAPDASDAAFAGEVQRVLNPVFASNAQVAAAGNLSDRAPLYEANRPVVLKAHAGLAALEPTEAWRTAHSALLLWLEALGGEYATGPPCAQGDQDKCAEYREYVRLAGEALQAAQGAMPG